jgi:uncharacterized protein YifN (PemK superfamily)
MIKKLFAYLFDKKVKKVDIPNNSIILKGVQPNFAISNAYRIKLNKMVTAMMKDIIPYIIYEYKQSQTEITNIVGDSAVDEIYRLITVRFGKWQMFFNMESEPLATKQVDDINKNVDYQFTTNAKPLKEFLPNKFDTFKIKLSEQTKQLALAKEASIKENVNLIRNLPDKAMEQIHQAVMSSISRGRDVSYLRDELMKIDTMTKNRAKLITRDQTNKITSVLNVAKQANLGITKNVWHHSHAGKEPRKSHVEADGKVYDIRKGCLIDGEYIYSGQKINCRCYSSPVLEFE